MPRKIKERFNLVDAEVDVTGFQRYMVVRSRKVAEERLESMVAPGDDTGKPMSIAEARRILAARESAKVLVGPSNS